jgi:RNA polymerase sigma factor (sigma-70 family)
MDTSIGGVVGGPNERTSVQRIALPVRRALLAFLRAIEAAGRRAACDGSPEEERDRRRRVVHLFIKKVSESPDVDTIETFETVLNRCLSFGYRARPLAAFAFSVLEPRFAARARRRLTASGFDASPDDVADVVGAAAETLARLIRDARRDEYTLRYALLLSLADHRAIDLVRSRRRRPETLCDLASDGDEGRDLAGQVAGPRDPESELDCRERTALAHRMRDAVFLAVNTLPPRERAALIAVELRAEGYPEIARLLSLSPTDVGNVVRRARLLRDRALTPHLRAVSASPGEVCLGFNELQESKVLRLQMLRWSVEMGAGVCPRCAHGVGHLHDADAPCP